jgi:hypothetical protein
MNKGIISILLLVIVSTATTSSEAFLPTRRIRVDARAAADTDYIYRKDVRLYQSSASYDPSKSSTSSTATSAAAGQTLLYPGSSTSTTSATTKTSIHIIVDGVSDMIKNPLGQAIASSAIFVVLDVFIKNVFRLRGVHFPSSLAGCTGLAVTLLVSPYHRSMYAVLSPGARLLQKFLMVFLVPNLIVLPLCDGCGSITEVRFHFLIKK